MKRQHLQALLLSVVMLTSLVGCGSSEKTPDAMPSSNEYSSQRYYSLNYDNTILYVVNEDGELENQYDLEELAKKLADIYPRVGLAAEDYALYSDGILYFKNIYYASKEPGDNYDEIYALDPESGEAVRICSKKDVSIFDLDIYDGKLFFETMPSKSYSFKTNCYEIKDGLSYEEVDPGFDAYFNATKEYYSCDRTNYKISDCIARKFDEVGFDLVKKDQTIYKAEMDGTITPVYEAESGTNVYVSYFDSDMAILELYEDGNYFIGYYRIDLATGKTTLISDDEDKQFFAYDANYLYYTDDESTCLDMYNRKLFAFDITDGSSKLLVEETTVPGTNTSDIFSYYVSIYGSRIFVPMFEDNKYVWNIIDPCEADPSPRSLGYVAETFDIFDYGTVDYISSENKCPDCDTTLYMFYGEKFVLNSEFSDYADEINQFISDYIDGSENVSSNSMMFANTSCDTHQEYPDTYNEATKYHISDVSVIEDRYLTVSYESYYTYDPYQSLQFLFDLTTGERYRLSDFYTGTNEQFKELVANKVKEDYSTADPHTYYAQSADEAYQQAYDSVEIDDRAFFTESGIDYLFYSQDLGPYHPGITIHITYEELLGRSTLSD